MTKPKQLELFGPELPDGLTCFFGEAWLGDHPKCRAYAEDVSFHFQAALTPAERTDPRKYPDEKQLKARRFPQSKP